jgi:cytochrome c oxidase assembly factor 5
MVDMRKRFRGNYTVKITEGEAPKSGGQLYAGKPAYADPTPTGTEEK